MAPVVEQFVSKINAHDLDGLIALMAPNHVFVDSLGNKSFRPTIERGWEEYFAMVPDYWVRIHRTISDDDISVLVGEAGGTFVPDGGVLDPKNAWKTPAVWVVRVEHGKLAEWRIFCDNEPIREKMRVPQRH